MHGLFNSRALDGSIRGYGSLASEGNRRAKPICCSKILYVNNLRAHIKIGRALESSVCGTTRSHKRCLSISGSKRRWSVPAENVQEGDDDVGVELGGAAPKQFTDSLVDVEPVAIGAALSHGVVSVGNGDEATRERDGQAGQLRRIATTTEPLV